MSLILDCRSKQDFPNCSRTTRRTHSTERYIDKVHLLTLGVINHGSSTASFYVNLNMFPDNQNFICTAILYEVKRHLQESNNRPDTLFIQVDNCCPQNKNKIFLTFCSWLVSIKWFRSVQVSYLLTGHTHTDVDQLFCEMHTITEENYVLTLEDYCNGIHHMFNQSKYKYEKINTFHHNTCYNWADWFGAITYDCLNIDQCHGFLCKTSVQDNKEIVTIQGRLRNYSPNNIWSDTFEITSAWPTTNVPVQDPDLSVFPRQGINTLLSVLSDEFDLRHDALIWWQQLRDNPTQLLDINNPNSIVSFYLLLFIFHLIKHISGIMIL